MTMGTALHQARKLLGVGQVPDEVLLLSGSDNARSRFTTNQRCPQSQWAASAKELARIMAPLERYPPLVATLGFEAHLLYASSLAVAEDATAWHVPTHAIGCSNCSETFPRRSSRQATRPSARS
jgi:hypothetical protein